MATKAPETDESGIEPEPKAPAPLDAVIILKDVDEKGNISVSVQPNGTVLATEVQTLLEMAIPEWRAKIGLPAR
jgi:hypothetical protein